MGGQALSSAGPSRVPTRSARGRVWCARTAGAGTAECTGHPRASNGTDTTHGLQSRLVRNLCYGEGLFPETQMLLERTLPENQARPARPQPCKLSRGTRGWGSPGERRGRMGPHALTWA